jgi:surface antigen-like variable number repeat protein
MSRTLVVIALVLTLFSLLVVAASAQSQFWDKKCPQPIYASHDVARPARITERPDFSRVTEAFRAVHGRVRLEAVLCRTGQVTDIRIIEGGSPTVNDFVSAAVSTIRFVPAELNVHSVSQKVQLAFEINNGNVKEIPVSQTNAQLVEGVSVLGNRRFSAKRILDGIGTRAGEPYNEAQVKLDFDKLLATGQFDKLTSRVFVQDGLRGGVGVYFELHELPVIGVVSFEGLKIDPALVRKAWQDAQINLETGEPYAPSTGKVAIRVIKLLLDSMALNYSKVELRTEQLPTTVNLTFVITNQ